MTSHFTSAEYIIIIILFMYLADYHYKKLHIFSWQDNLNREPRETIIF